LEKYKIFLICTGLERIRGEKQTFLKFGPFSSLSVPNKPNFGHSLSGPSNFYSALFDLCGRTVGQLATVPISWSVYYNFVHDGRYSEGGGRAPPTTRTMLG
jgi:hypothetical protein